MSISTIFHGPEVEKDAVVVPVAVVDASRFESSDRTEVHPVALFTVPDSTIANTRSPEALATVALAGEAVPEAETPTGFPPPETIVA
jgi:hypothetical protein